MSDHEYFQGYLDGVNAVIAAEKRTQAQRKQWPMYQFNTWTRRMEVVPEREQNSLPEDQAQRDQILMAEGLLYYFPNALAEVAKLSKIGNDQHNPGQPMHWARDKSKDHANKIMKHLVDAGKKDSKGVRHSTSVAWRALAMLQIELEEQEGVPRPRNAY